MPIRIPIRTVKYWIIACHNTVRFINIKNDQLLQSQSYIPRPSAPQSSRPPKGRKISVTTPETFSWRVVRSRGLITKPVWPRSLNKKPVLRTHDILLRIRIRGSMLLTNGSGSGSCYFRHWPSIHQQKTNLKKFFCLLLFEGTFTSFFKDKKSKEVTKQ